MALAIAAVLQTACTTVADCGEVLGNKQDARIRSSAMRMLLADAGAASARFVPYAAMSALVYEQAGACKHRLPPVEHKDTFTSLLEANGWRPYTGLPGLPECDDEVGTFFRVWAKNHDSHTEVVLVFRGTKGGVQDWITGNLRWITRFLPGDDQYDRSRALAGQAIEHIKKTRSMASGSRPIHFYAAGHSLGGGLAQNVFYAYPTDVRQAYAFNASPVTGYADNDSAAKRRACDCRDEDLRGEARVYRIYETDEVLAWLRFPLKLALPLNRHIQEVRFNVGDGHSMSGLAKGMIDAAVGKPLAQRDDWWKGRPAVDGRNCTAAYAESRRSSCQRGTEEDTCPR